MESNLPAKQTEFKIYGVEFPETDYTVIKASGLLSEFEVRKMSKTSKLDSQKELIIALRKATEVLRQKPMSDNDLFMTAGLIYEGITKEFKHAKVEEVLACIDFGSYGKYESSANEVTYVSPKNVLRWFRRYLDQKYTITNGYLKAKEKGELKSHKEMHMDKTLHYWSKFHDLVKGVFEHYVEHNELSDKTHLVIAGFTKIKYQSNKGKFLDSLFDIDFKLKLIEDAKLNWSKQHEPKKGEYEGNTYTLDIPKEEEPDYIDIAKKECLKTYFDSIETIDYEEIKRLSNDFAQSLLE